MASNPSEGTTVQNNVWTCGGNNSNKKVTAICSRFTTIVREAYSTTDTTQVSCQPGENLIGGGCYDRTDGLGWHYSKPMFSPSTWTCDGAGSKKHARAICIADTTLRIDVASQDNPNSDYVPDWVAGPVCTSSQIMIGGGCASLSTPGSTNTQWWNNGFYGNSNFNNGYNCVDYESQGWCSAETGCTTHCDYQGVSNNGNNPNWDCSHCDTDQQKWHCAACGRPNGVATDNCALCSGNALIRNTFGGQRKLQMSGPANWKSADSDTDMSVDTTGWLNHDTYQHPCSDYVSHGWCDATTKTFVPGQEGTGGSTYNNPELNCNACGKAESLNKRWLCGGHGSQKQVWTICASEPSNYVRPSAITNLLVGDDVRTDYTGY